MTGIVAKFNQAFGKLGVLPEETENNNHSHPKWTLTAMEKYMRDESDQSSVALGLVSQQPPPPPSTGTANNKRRTQQHHLVPALMQNGADALLDSEESSPSWASSSAGNTPSYGSSGLAFEFGNNRLADDSAFEKSTTTPLITTTTCTPKSTPENNPKKVMPLSLSSDRLSALDSAELELVGSGNKSRKSRKDSQSSVKSEDSRGTPSKTSKLRKLLRRTRSAGCSKDVPNSSQFSKEKPPVTKTKSADSAPCSREDGDEKLKKSSRKTLAQDMKMRLSFLRRRHTDSSLQASVRPSPEEAHKWAESFQELTNSKYGLSLFRAFLSREFSEENIDFWLACEDYKRSRPNKLTAKARKIYDDFVAVQAPKEVNLDSSMRSAIYNHLQNPDRHSFDPAQRRIQGLMEQDAYARFLQSDLYKDLTQGNSTNISS